MKNCFVFYFDMKNIIIELSMYRFVRFGYIKRFVKNKYYKMLVNLICKFMCIFLLKFIYCVKLML